MLIELLQNFEYEPPHMSPGDPGYFRAYINFKSEGRGGVFTCQIDAPLENGGQPIVVREANRIRLKKMVTQQLANELADYGVESVDAISTLLDPPAMANKRLPQDCAFLEILCCFDFYAPTKQRKELELIVTGHSVYFEYKQQGDDFIFSVKSEFDINLRGREAGSLTPAEKQKLRIKNILINALISLIAKKLFVTDSSVRNNYKNLSIKLNRIDYAVLMDTHRQINPSSQSLQASLQSGNGTLNIDQAINILNHEIYSCLSEITYADKMWFIRLIKDVFLKLQNLNEACTLYTQISEFSRKEIVDVHKNPGTDFWLIKDKSQSWQQLMHDIREHAFKLLLKLVGISEVDAKHLLDPNNPQRSTAHIDISEPEAVELVLKEYRNNLIFKEHRGNLVFAEKLFDTQTVKNIDRLIEECQFERSERERIARVNAGL